MASYSSTYASWIAIIQTDGHQEKTGGGSQILRIRSLRNGPAVYSRCRELILSGFGRQENMWQTKVYTTIE